MSKRAAAEASRSTAKRSLCSTSTAASTPSMMSADTAAAHWAKGNWTARRSSAPWHGWRYNVTTGENELVPDLPTQKYEVKIEGEDILVDLS